MVEPQCEGGNDACTHIDDQINRHRRWDVYLGLDMTNLTKYFWQVYKEEELGLYESRSFFRAPMIEMCFLMRGHVTPQIFLNILILLGFS
jgi:hypothetical protein